MGLASFHSVGSGTLYGSLAMGRPALGMSGSGHLLIMGTGSMAMHALGATGIGAGGNLSGTGTMGLGHKGATGAGVGGNLTGTGIMGLPTPGLLNNGEFIFFPYTYVGDVAGFYLDYLDGRAATTLYVVPGVGYLLQPEANSFYELPVPPDDGRWVVNQLPFTPFTIEPFNATPGALTPGFIVPGNPGTPEMESLTFREMVSRPVGHMWYRTKSAYNALGQRRRKRRR
jgi:hypothetical protein